MFVQDKATIIGKNGCLAFCYLYCLGIEDDVELIRMVAKSMSVNLLGKDCSVKDADRFLEYWSGRRFVVTKKDITSIEDIKEPTPVLFSKNGEDGHWVVVENGKIVFNSIETSVNVKEGVPIAARVLKYK